jgi:hypothetical protein
MDNILDNSDSIRIMAERIGKFEEVKTNNLVKIAALLWFSSGIQRECDQLASQLSKDECELAEKLVKNACTKMKAAKIIEKIKAAGVIGSEVAAIVLGPEVDYKVDYSIYK